jgi:hypothetical protein
MALVCRFSGRLIDWWRRDSLLIIRIEKSCMYTLGRGIKLVMLTDMNSYRSRCSRSGPKIPCLLKPIHRFKRKNTYSQQYLDLMKMTASKIPKSFGIH